MVEGLERINSAAAGDDPQALLQELQAEAVGMRSVVPECAETYQERLKEALQEKMEGSWLAIVKTVLRYCFFFSLSLSHVAFFLSFSHYRTHSFF